MFPYESNYVCHFFRLWGNREAATGDLADDSLLGNMQNDFDAKFGDVCGDANSRFFFIEFKRLRKGFCEEVSKSMGKTHRVALYEHLRRDSTCRQIARQGHFGCYPDRSGSLVFEPYAHCPAAIKTKEQIVDEIFSSPRVTSYNELDHQAWKCGFPKFHEQITSYDLSQCKVVPGFFAKGLGISAEHLKMYVSCMYQHLQTTVDSSGVTILGAFNRQTNRLVAFNDTIENLIFRLQSALNSPKERTISKPSGRIQF
ncbi:hypothetical protein I6J77_11870 [Rhodanobacter sp. FDAARGOS 1247]|uniref:hypothetical protein n=1 Tax=Rhodanobacter sp. FDAARGOS 1247 TaxID=2778082 RepID=UPI0019529C83|nr:hypothetical protein [Rhodanobacter sp. FDAARGOS 1247]QRP62828.1 hypothetical protein I6J77_11870 [Rhodanobacter sp. FDAARGOS 1247]